MSDGEKEEGDMHAKREVERKREEIFFCVFFSSSACFFCCCCWEVDNRQTKRFLSLS